MNAPVRACPPAHGGAVVSAQLRALPEDFQVREEMGFEPDGEGEHLWLWLRKTGWNTTDAALALARAAGLPLRAVGYSGLKDRQAVTEQWFSLHLPGQADPDLSALPAGLELLRQVRHRRKLHRGTHRSNHFRLRLRNLTGDPEALEQRLQAVQREGVPNYFGEQRFGRAGDNAERGRAWLLGQADAPRKPALRSLWLSAVRSDLFNRILALRVKEGVWNRLLSGDLLQRDGRRGLFPADEDPLSAARLAEGEVHPTAPLPGAGGMASSGACAALEQQVLAAEAELVAALAAQGVDAARRATRLWVGALEWERDGADLLLTLRLPAGAFATTVLAEFANVREQRAAAP